MKLDLTEIDESEMEIDDLEVERDLQLAAVDAIRRARRSGTNYVISEEEQIKEIPGDKTGPYEERLLARAEELNLRIAKLRQAEQLNPVLNDAPPSKE